MKKRKIEPDLRNFPSALHPLLAGADIYDSSSSSDAQVFFCDSGYYIKVGKTGELREEAVLTQSFHRMGLGVEVVAYLTQDSDYLVTRSAVGEDLTHHVDKPEHLCKVLADAMRSLHRRSPANMPLSPRQRRYLESANGPFSGGAYDESVLTERFRISSKQEAWTIMQANKHDLYCDTLIHGDFCLPNVIAAEGRFSTFIDFNLSGIGDRHIDLYWAIWSLQYNLKTEKYTDLFLDLYGRENFDERMLKVIAAFECFG